jgi:ADP-ribose pyrophosphatase YjhB (NUDIX family)
MKRDIIFPTEDFVFSYRVGGLLIQNGKVLLQKPKNDDYAIIGGHVAALETTMETLKREYMEELHAEIEIDRLLAIGENFFPWGNKPCHQICLYYNIHLMGENKIPMDGVIHGYDELGNERIDMDFCWVPLEQLENGLKVYPLELIPHIVNEPKEVIHFVSREV